MRNIRLVFFVVALVHGAFYAALMPPWQAPDEVAHFEYSYLLATLRRPISLDDESIPLEHRIISSLYQFHAWTYRSYEPPAIVPDRLAQTRFGNWRTLDRFSLSYIVYALAVWPLLDQDIVIQLYAMRLVSIVIGALVVLLAFETAQLVSPGQSALAVATAGFVLFLPQHAYIAAAVSDGNLAELAASACIFLVAAMWRQGMRWPQAAACVLCAMVAIFSKATAYFLVGFLLIVGPALVFRWQPAERAHRAWSWQRLATGGLVVGGLGALLIPVILLVPPLRYIRLMLNANLKHLSDFVPYMLALNSAGLFGNALWQTFNSFWAMFGWMAFWFPSPVYIMLLGGVVLALASLVWHLHRLPPAAEPRRSLLAVLGLAAVLEIAVLVSWFVASPNGVNYFQGRYLFAAVVPIAVLLAAGGLALVPDRWQPRAALLCVVLMILFDAAAMFTLAWPFFYRAGLA